MGTEIQDIPYNSSKKKIIHLIKGNFQDLVVQSTLNVIIILQLYCEKTLGDDVAQACGVPAAGSRSWAKAQGPVQGADPRQSCHRVPEEAEAEAGGIQC